MKMRSAIANGLLILSAIVLLSILSYNPARTTPRAHKPSAAVVAPTLTAPAVPQVPAAKPQPKAPAVHKSDAHTRRIVISLEDRRLALVEDGQVKQVYPVAVGKDSTPSPTGTFTIMERVENPTYYHDGKIVPPGPGNPVGDRWMGLSKAGYGIHGTNAPKSIGKAASHGCIRMARPDLEKLFAEVRTGDTVEIVGARNEETIALFGAPAAPLSPAAPAAAQTVLAQSAPQSAQPAPDAPASATLSAASTAVVPAAIPISR
jgi:lipoprotein-anchoring transpeptidase ErfK/SrfK